jgi:hypothetical protein
MTIHRDPAGHPLAHWPPRPQGRSGILPDDRRRHVAIFGSSGMGQEGAARESKGRLGNVVALLDSFLVTAVDARLHRG